MEQPFVPGTAALEDVARRRATAGIPSVDNEFPIISVVRVTRRIAASLA